MKDIPIGISLVLIALSLFIFINTESDIMMLIAGILFGVGIGMLFSINRIRKN